VISEASFNFFENMEIGSELQMLLLEKEYISIRNKSDHIITAGEPIMLHDGIRTEQWIPCQAVAK
jgi:hypothetical protein